MAYNLQCNWRKALIVALGLVALTANAEPLKPYHLSYKTTAKGLSMNLERSLKLTEKGDYLLTNQGKILLAGFIETSVFEQHDGNITPNRYVYKGTGLISQKRELVFDTEANIIKSYDKKTWHELELTPTTYDRVSQLEQLRLSLIQGADPKMGFAVEIADRRKIKQYKLDYAGEEIIETELGPIPTIRFHRGAKDDERESNIWLAPDWDFLMVKTTHVEDGTLIAATVSEAYLDGQPLRATPAEE
jgi:hypothetical protein